MIAPSKGSLLAVGFLACVSTFSQTETPKTVPSDCVVVISKVSQLKTVKISRWRSGMGWMTNAESPSQTGDVWRIVTGTIDCPGKGSGIPMGKVALVGETAGSYPLVGYSAPFKADEDFDFNGLENSPSTGRTDAKGLVWGVIPAKDTGIMTLYLSDKRITEKDVGISLLFAAPEKSGPLHLEIRGIRKGRLPDERPAATGRKSSS